MGEKNFFNTLKTLDTYLISPDFDLFFFLLLLSFDFNVAKEGACN